MYVYMYKYIRLGRITHTYICMYICMYIGQLCKLMPLVYIYMYVKGALRALEREVAG